MIRWELIRRKRVTVFLRVWMVCVMLSALAGSLAPGQLSGAAAQGDADPLLVARLEAIAEGKQATLERWFVDSRDALRLVSRIDPRLPDLLASQPANAALQSAFNTLLANAVIAHPGLGALFVYDAQGTVVAASDAARIGNSVVEASFFQASLQVEQVHALITRVPGSFALVASVPVVGADGQTVGALAGELNLSVLAEIMSPGPAMGSDVDAYLVAARDHVLLTPSRFDVAPVGQGVASEAIESATGGQSGVGVYANPAGQTVSGVYRWLPQALVLIVEMPAAQSSTGDAVAQAATATVTPQPDPTQVTGGDAEPTAVPDVFPPATQADVTIAEQVFEEGRMVWVQPVGQIWVLAVTREGGGDWYCYEDTFVEGESESDPELTPPEGLQQPVRGFGKVWRTEPGVRDLLGWALTPEFGLTSPYTYLPGGTVENEQYVPGPGEHRLTMLSGETFSFFEQEVRGDCIGGTWSLAR